MKLLKIFLFIYVFRQFNTMRYVRTEKYKYVSSVFLLIQPYKFNFVCELNFYQININLDQK